MPSIPYRPPLERDTLTLNELAGRTGISMTTAYELARRNELPVPVIRIGRRYLFSRRAFEAVIRDHDAHQDHPGVTSQHEVVDAT